MVPPMTTHPTRHRLRLLAAAAVSTVIAVPLVASSASAGGAAPSLPSISPTAFAAGGTGQTLPDDVTSMGGDIFVTFQNGVPTTGAASTGPQDSTIVEFDHAGHEVTTWSLKGRCDGLTADPAHHRILATVNEDLNSYFAVIRPGDPAPKTYTYSPSPAEGAGPNGGTDSITLGPDGTIYVAHSNPDPSAGNTAALYTVDLDGSTAQLARVFGVADPATDAVSGQPVTLALTDPDSNRYIPKHDPVFGGSILQDSQGDGQIIIVTHPGTKHQALLRLVLSNAENSTQPTIDDMVEVTGPGTLYVVDQGADTISAIDTTGFAPGTIVIAQPLDSGNAGQLGILDPATGVITHFSATFNSPKGLLFVPSHHQHGDGEGDD